MIHAWVERGLLYVVRYTPGEAAETAEHAVLSGDHVVFIANGAEGEVEPLLDLEKAQINMGREWPPRDAPIAL